ncbi:MAG: 16S rRNA (guanine(527)-N(7))-methyltransferase RsmG [Terriglobia bacterium]
MRDAPWLAQLLEPFGLSLGEIEVTQLLAYLNLLIRWNQHVNLVASASAEVWVWRHFAESLYLARRWTLRGRLLDVGSGAGFPALPLKITFPALSVTLLEPTGKKRAFLKEVIRKCRLSDVDVRSERLADFGVERGPFDSITSRAVGKFGEIVPRAAKLLGHDGRIFLWVSSRQRVELDAVSKWVDWGAPLDIPGTDHSQIWAGIRRLSVLEYPPSP